MNKFEKDFNKYKNQYEYIKREYKVNAFYKDIHIIKCLTCGVLRS